MKRVFLYKIVNSDDRDCVAYIDNEPMRFECGHYFGSVILQGACYSGYDFEDYENIETILTKEEYARLVDFSNAIHELGFGISEGDERYQKGVALCKAIQDVYDKLNGEANGELFEKIWEEEKEYLYDEYSLDDDECEEIAGKYSLEYKDRGIVSCVFDDAYDCGEEEAISLGYVEYGETSSPQYRFFDFEAFGEALADEDERYYKLEDGRIVVFNY